MKYMKSSGFEVKMASATGPEIKELVAIEDCDHLEIELSRTLNPLTDLAVLFKMIKLIRKVKPDIVHTHSPKAGIIGMLASRICGVKLKIHTVAGLPLMETTGNKRKLLSAVEKITYGCADWVIPNSIQLNKFIVESGLIHDQRKLKVLGKGSSNGIDLEYFSRTESVLDHGEVLRQQYQIDANDLVLCFVGRLAFYKGINELVAAFKELSKEFSSLKLLLVGPLEELNPLEEDTVQAMASMPNIIQAGHQDDIRPFLAISDIFVFPSYREGFPQSLMQACAMGLPCIATDINGCNEMVFEGINGHLIKPKDITGLVNACKHLILNDDIRHQFSKTSRHYIESNFEQKKVWTLIRDFYVEKLRRNEG